MSKVRILIFVVAMANALPAIASGETDQTDAPKKELTPLARFALIEGLCILNAALAVPSPEIYGILLTVFSPLGAENANPATAAVGMGGAASLGLYNAIELRKSRYSGKDVFVRNLVAWNLLLGGLYLTERLTGRSSEDGPIAIALSPDGFAVSAFYRF